MLCLTHFFFPATPKSLALAQRSDKKQSCHPEQGQQDFPQGFWGVYSWVGAHVPLHPSAMALWPFGIPRNHPTGSNLESLKPSHPQTITIKEALH